MASNWSEDSNFMCSTKQSYNSDDSYKSRQRNLDRIKKDCVSKWSLTDLDEKNIFYSDREMSLSLFMEHVKKKIPRQCSPELPDFIKKIIEHTKEALHFSYDEQQEEEEGDEAIYSARQEAIYNQKTFDVYYGKMMDEHQELNLDNKKLLNSWCHDMETFLKYLKVYLETKLASEKESEREGQFQQLLWHFTKIFFMEPELGEARKREVTIKEVIVESVPDIHYIKDTSNPDSFKTLMVLCEEVQPTYLDSASLTDNFKVTDILDRKILGQHGGELLLEKEHSLFKPKVLGMICARSKMIFTYMDMKSSHYKVIIKDGEVTDSKHKCTIYYTRPFDILIKKERDEILDFLFWIGYVQSVMPLDIDS